jgi:hypothetical protein
MAESPYIPPKDWLGQLSGSAKEARDLIAKDNQIRRNEVAKILSVKDIQSGKWDADRTLRTTLNGVERDITLEDLKAFKKNISTVQANFSGGMTAQQVIKHSRQIDRERASQQITMAVPVSATKGKVRFITNAGPDSKDLRHHVTVNFLHFDSQASAANKTSRQSALSLRKLPLKIECDCGRWRFWYKYIATIGGFNAGTPETGFPKIRNPKLGGVACKHLLRVMKEIDSGGAIIGFLTKQMDKGKAHDENKAQSKFSQKEAEKLIKNQAKRTTGHEVKAREVREAIRKVADKTPKPKQQKGNTKRISQNKNMKAQEAQFRASIKPLNLSDEQTEAIVAAHIAASKRG